jgi:hypothetical protein
MPTIDKRIDRNKTKSGAWPKNLTLDELEDRAHCTFTSKDWAPAEGSSGR